MSLFVQCFVVFLLFAASCDIVYPKCDPKPGTPPNAPMGMPKGLLPGRVSWFYDRSACSWNGTDGYYWQAANLNQNLVDKMVTGTVMSICGDKISSIAGCWDLIFRHFNREHSGKDIGYTPGETIIMKVNLNVEMKYDILNNYNSVSPQYLRSILRQLVNFAGVPQNAISMVDAARVFPTYYVHPPVGFGSEFPQVKVIDNQGTQEYCTKGWNTTLIPKCVKDATYVIQVDAFRGHSMAGMTETAKNWFGALHHADFKCIVVPDMPDQPGHCHGFVNVSGLVLNEHDYPGLRLPPPPMGVYNPRFVVVDLLGHEDLTAKGLIFLVDATYGGIKQDPSEPIRFEMAPFYDDWSCSVFASLDPVALDSVTFDFLLAEPRQPFPKKGCVDNYLHEAALAHDPPSQTAYAPSGYPLLSLGCHEHWNDVSEKLYSRNLGKEYGIELVKVHESF